MEYPAIEVIKLAIPFFFLLIGVEVAYSLWKRKGHYDLHDSLADLSCGILQQVGGVFTAAFYLGLYVFFYELRWFELPNHWLTWVGCFLAVDLAYYWFHRSAHRINLFWGGHAPHHQSEEYNLTVALRQGFFQEPFSTIYYLPLALLGFHPLLFVICLELNTVYQFWIHTRSVGKLGWLELWLNTPSHHRVHHGVNPQYIDRNHAGALIVWDRLFGTFEEEQEEPVYGVVKPLHSWNPLRANLDHWITVWRMSRGLKPWDQFRIWFMPPGWLPDQPEPLIPEVSAATVVKYRTPQPKSLSLYIFAQFLLSLGLALYLLEQPPGLNVLNLSLALLVAVGLVGVSGLQESKTWALPLEGLRLLALGAGALWFFQLQLPGIVLAAVVVGMLIWLGLSASRWLKRPETAVTVDLNAV